MGKFKLHQRIKTASAQLRLVDTTDAAEQLISYRRQDLSTTSVKTAATGSCQKSKNNH